MDILLVIISFLIAMWASFNVSSTFKKIQQDK